jgi:hypothetical protein
MANVIEEAKSGRTCKKPIAKGELRFGEEAPNAFGDQPSLRWHHLACAAAKLPAELEGLRQNSRLADADLASVVEQVETGAA